MEDRLEVGLWRAALGCGGNGWRTGSNGGLEPPPPPPLGGRQCSEGWQSSRLAKLEAGGVAQGGGEESRENSNGIAGGGFWAETAFSMQT
jgi:hypothetical protein